MGGGFSTSRNSTLTQIIFPDSSQSISSFWVNECNLTGTLDVSGLTGLSQSFHAESNPNLTSILLPTLNASIYLFDVEDCSLKQWNVDNILVKFDTWFTANLPTENLYLYLFGGNTASPTNGALNTNLVHIEDIFDNSTAYTATITIN